ncbi:hypothetical protein D9M68_917650 [compost metagenome]
MSASPSVSVSFASNRSASIVSGAPLRTVKPLSLLATGAALPRSKVMRKISEFCKVPSLARIWISMVPCCA